MRRLLITGTRYFLRTCYISRGLYLERLKMFGKKNLGKYTMFIGIEVLPRLFCPVFSFSPVLIQRH